MEEEGLGHPLVHSWGEGQQKVSVLYPKACVCILSQGLPVRIPGEPYGGCPGGPVVKTSLSNPGGVGLIPGQGAKILHASWPKTPTHKTEAILRQIQ